MQHLPITEIVSRLVREIACTKCYQRPPGSESLGPEVSRTCEATCPLFFHLPALVHLAGQVDDTPGACETAIQGSVCGGCRLSPTAGDYCADYAARTCPLSRYSAEVLNALQRLVRLDPNARGSQRPLASAARARSVAL